MNLRQLFESQKKVAIATFGRMNPPTIGHDKLIKKLKSIDGDHYLFLSQTQESKNNPLPFDVKLKFAKQFFPQINVGHPSVRTPIQMLQMLESLEYTDVICVAGADRVAQFDKLFNQYNGKEYNFDSIQVVSAGDRDPDAAGASGMSATKMRAAAAAGEFESFAQGVPEPRLAKKLYDAVRTGMGVSGKQSAGGVLEMASYEGNLGLMELFAFFSAAGKTHPELVNQVKLLIKQGDDKQVWKIVQQYTGTTLTGAEFEGTIAEAIMLEATQRSTFR